VFAFALPKKQRKLVFYQRWPELSTTENRSPSGAETVVKLKTANSGEEDAGKIESSKDADIHCVLGKSCSGCREKASH
jgi:hypothetical protein